MASKQQTGTVEEVAQASDRAPIRFKLTWTDGDFTKGYWYKVWATVKEDGKEVKNPAFDFIKNNEGNEVTVRYTSKKEKYEGKDRWENTVWEAWGGSGSSGSAAPQSNNSWAPSGITEETVRQIVREELRLANVYSAFPGTTDETPDYTDFKNTADQEGFNENGLEKRWAKFSGEGHWHHATQDQLEKFAVELGFKWPSKLVEVGAPEGSF